MIKQQKSTDAFSLSGVTPDFVNVDFLAQSGFQVWKFCAPKWVNTHKVSMNCVNHVRIKNVMSLHLKTLLYSYCLDINKNYLSKVVYFVGFCKLICQNFPKKVSLAAHVIR